MDQPQNKRSSNKRKSMNALSMLSDISKPTDKHSRPLVSSRPKKTTTKVTILTKKATAKVQKASNMTNNPPPVKNGVSDEYLLKEVLAVHLIDEQRYKSAEQELVHVSDEHEQYEPEEQELQNRKKQMLHKKARVIDDQRFKPAVQELQQTKTKMRHKKMKKLQQQQLQQDAPSSRGIALDCALGAPRLPQAQRQQMGDAHNNNNNAWNNDRHAPRQQKQRDAQNDNYNNPTDGPWQKGNAPNNNARDNNRHAPCQQKRDVHYPTDGPLQTPRLQRGPQNNNNNNNPTDGALRAPRPQRGSHHNDNAMFDDLHATRPQTEALSWDRDAVRGGKKQMRKMRYEQQQLSPMEFLLVSAHNSKFTGSVLVAGGTASNNGNQYYDEHQQAGNRIVEIITAETVNAFSRREDPRHHAVYVQPLLVLDLNGILCHRLRSEEKTAHIPKNAYRESVHYVASTPIIPRTDLHEFLSFLDRHFCLAVWTSAKNKTAMELVTALFPTHVADRLLFVWAQHKCDIGKGVKSSDNRYKPLFEKDLNKVWKEYPLWNANNTLLMDDSAEKCTQWHLNAVHPPALHGLKAGAVAYGQLTDEENTRMQRVFFRNLVNFWNHNSLVQTWDEESGDATTYLQCPGRDLKLLNNSNGMIHFLRHHAVGHMGWN